MFGDLYADVIRFIKSWQPQKKYGGELQYRDDLMEFLRDSLNRSDSPFMLSPAKRVSIRKEDGRGLCDIAVDRRIGIELKKDLSKKAQINRLVGQIVDYKREYEDIVIVLVGETNKDALDGLKDAIDDLVGNQMGIGLSRQPRIKIIDKGSKSKSKSSKEKKPKSPFDFGLRSGGNIWP